MVIKVTEKALSQVVKLSKETEKDGLRVAVVGGGCSGLQYRLGWDDIKEDDIIQDYDSGIRVLIDQKSAPFLVDSTLDFHDGLNKSGFEVINPNAANSCGCGKSFS